MTDITATPSIPDYYRRAWEIVSRDLGGWIVFYAVFIGLSLLTCGLATVLMPNVMREVRDSLADERGPDLGRLFDMSNLSNDFINYIVWMGAITVGSAAGGVGGTIAAVALQFQMPMAADDRYAPLDNSKLSFKHVGQHIGDHVIFMMISGALGMVAMFFCLLPLPLVAPVIGVAHWLWYQDCRAEIDGLAREAGIATTAALPGPVADD